MKLRKNLFWIPLISFLAYLGCAKQTSPTGGPKDTIPPVLVTAIPEREAVNVKGKKIEMTFSELIILNNPKEQLIVTPTVGKNFEISAKKKTVTLELEKDLEPNTTYTINFRDAIQDITEKNPVRNFQLAFSTGPYVDSLSITGNVSDILKGTKVEDATVAIQLPIDTFDIFKHPAVYLTKTNKQGNFRIDHLKPGTYYVYAIADKNKNLIADSKTESYGFRTNPILLKTDTSKISIGITRLDARPLKVGSARPYNTYFNIKTSKGIHEFKLTASDSSDLFYCYGEDAANVRLYNTIGTKDSLAFNFTAMDSIGNYIDTVLYAKFSKRDVEPEKFISKISAGTLHPEKALLQSSISFSKPLREINFDTAYFEIDSLTRVNITKDDFSWDAYNNTLTLNKKIDKSLLPKKPSPDAKPDTTKKHPTPKNNLYFAKATFMSVEGDSSTRIVSKISVLETESLSKIIYDFRTSEPTIIQLLDKNSDIIREHFNQPKGEFADLAPDQYSIRVVIDRNRNQMWDPGNYYKKEEPEKIIYYIEPDKGSEKITLKANWEYELSPMLITY